MNKRDLINVVHNAVPYKKNSNPLRPRREITLTQAEYIVDSLQGMFAQLLHAGGKLTWEGVGTFEVKVSPARSGRNPKTGASILIKSKKRVVFRAGKWLRAVVNHQF